MLRHYFPWRTFIFTAATAGILAACIDSDDYKIEGATATPSMVLPLAYGDLAIQDFLREDDSRYIKIADDGLLYLSYEQALKSQDITELLSFPDKSFNHQIPLPALVPANSPAQTLPPYETTLDFNFNPEKLSQMIINSGGLFINSFTAVPNNNFDYEVLVELPDFTKNGVAFSQRLPKGPSTLDLQGYQANFVSNVTPLRITVTRKASTNAYVLGGNLTVSMQFENFNYKIVKGFFGDQTANLPPQTIPIESFNPVDRGTVTLADPKLSFEVVNRYGIPVNVDFISLEARKQGQPPLAIQLDKVNPIAVGFPTTPGDSAKTTVNILNSKNIYNYNPDQFYYNAHARINAGLTSGNNFAEDKSNLTVRFKAQVPLYGTASGIILSDTTNLGIDDLKGSVIEEMFLIGNITNQLPMSAYLQLYLATDKNVITDSIFTVAQASSLVKSSSVNAAGELVSPGVYKDEIKLEKSKVDKILKADKVIILVRLQTLRDANGTQPDVKFKAGYKMNVKFGIRANITVNADL
jgi:hypothetical protein